MRRYKYLEILFGGLRVVDAEQHLARRLYQGDPRFRR